MAATSGSAPRRRILIVDDDPSIRYMLSRVLLNEGYAVQTASDGREGLKMLAAQEFDLVLLDLKMPVMSGQETLIALANSHPGLPVIIMTAYPGQTLEGGAPGVSALLQKPLDFQMLLDAIEKLPAYAGHLK